MDFSSNKHLKKNYICTHTFILWYWVQKIGGGGLKHGSVIIIIQINFKKTMLSKLGNYMDVHIYNMCITTEVFFSN